MDSPIAPADETLALLEDLHKSYSLEWIAEQLGVQTRTVQRWLSGNPPQRPYLVTALRQLAQAPMGKVDSPAFDTIDLFAGIGGIRSAFEASGGQCVMTSEWNKWSEKTYRANFPLAGNDTDPFIGDITTYSEDEVPNHDVLLAGFPCQPFSIAGVSKKNALGRPTGFKDKTQGTLFFDVARIIAAKRPAAFLLENVKNLKSHDRGRTFEVIRQTLTEELGYDLHERVIDGGAFVPQHRERIMLVGFREPRPDFSFDDMVFPEHKPVMRDILHRTDGTEPRLPWDGDRFFDHESQKVQDKYTLTPRLWEYLQNYAAKHRAAGNGFGYGLVGPDDRSRTLSARYYKDGSEILVAQGFGERPRRLTPRECARLMGFPDSFRIPVSDTQAYRQFGNSVVVPMIAEVARIMRPHVLAIMRHQHEE
ncbi:DNA (cytosine-5-)-methyltransferase [Pseudoclavibacter soli]|uniref:DNA (cytosine-5-)-methyltransferase n=1 Tax=Pseudoclavibacter soli TaxID=452623 RepID=UPI00048306CC|nr:DNA (cytosine-5-)-methyltransferase [Pseudoclavibacter soli]